MPLLHGVVAALAMGFLTLDRPQRLASIVASEKIAGGPGLTAIRAPDIGLNKGPTYRCRELALEKNVNKKKP